MAPVLQEIVVDCSDPAALAAFWGSLLQVRHVALDAGWAVVDAAPLFLAFQQVPEGKASAKNRLHIDVQVDDVTNWIARALELGANTIGEPQVNEAGDGFAVLRDPEGNEFCFVVDQSGAWRERTLQALDRTSTTSPTAHAPAPIHLTPIDLDTDTEALVAFLIGNEFPFHVAATIDETNARQRIAAGRFSGPDNAAFWVTHADLDRVGIAVLEDVADEGVMFDLRLATTHRGHGFGVPTLRALADQLFTAYPNARRFEGQTRQDNHAMRRVFEKAGFVKEAHYRQGWPTADGAAMDSIGYGLLRIDWESGITTPVHWAD